MTDTLQVIVGIILLIGVYILTQMVVGLRIKRAARRVVQDLETQQAKTPESAVALPYAKTNFLRLGLRDFRPKAIDALLHAGIIGRTADGRFYAIKRMPQ